MTGTGGAAGAPSAVLFFAVPVLALAAAVALRATGEVESAPSVLERLRGFAGVARTTAESEGVPPDLLLAMAAAESGGRRDARSGKGAVGLLQLMPGTAAEMADRGREPAPDLHDPETSLRLGARYLALQLRRYRGLPHAEQLALCAYNAGPRTVTDWIQEEPPEPEAADLGSWIRYRETRDYVRRVTAWRPRCGVLLQEVAAADVESRR